MGFRHWASTPPVSRRSRQSATGPPGGYPDRTHTGKRRRADDTRSTTYTVNLLSLGARDHLTRVRAARKAVSAYGTPIPEVRLGASQHSDPTVNALSRQAHHHRHLTVQRSAS